MWQIRDCTQSDFDQAFGLLQQLWPSRQLDRNGMRSVFERALCGDTQHYICATEHDRMVGFCSLTLTNNLWQAGYLAHVDELVVDEQYRRQGIGRSLLKSIVQLAAEKGCSRIELDSGFQRTEAHRFYEAEGFESRAYSFSKVI